MPIETLMGKSQNRITWPELPIIIATGFAEMEPGLTSYLPKLAKPFTEIQLAKVLANIAAKRSPKVDA